MQESNSKELRGDESHFPNPRGQGASLVPYPGWEPQEEEDEGTKEGKQRQAKQRQAGCEHIFTSGIKVMKAHVMALSLFSSWLSLYRERGISFAVLQCPWGRALCVGQHLSAKWCWDMATCPDTVLTHLCILLFHP